MNGQTYFYRIAAVNIIGESTKSNEGSATTTAPVTPPSPPPSSSGLNVVVTTNSPTYARGSVAVLDITVKDAATGSPLNGASVAINVQNPNGATAGSAVLKTSSSGVVKAGMGFSGLVPSGTYTVTVTATFAGNEPKTAQTTFSLV
jgi:uncharacterized protein YfaS (alpha-2-macroglobulin family)